MTPNRTTLMCPNTHKARTIASIMQTIPINELLTFFESSSFIPLIRRTNSRKANIAPTITDLLAIPVSEPCKMLFAKKEHFHFNLPFQLLLLVFFTPVRVFVLH